MGISWGTMVTELYGDSKHVISLKIAKERDAIEKSLQSDKMWYFVTTGERCSATGVVYTGKSNVSIERPGNA